MTEIKHLIEEWIEMRATLQRQLKMLESGEMRMGPDISDSTTQATIARIKAVDRRAELTAEGIFADARAIIGGFDVDRMPQRFSISCGRSVRLGSRPRIVHPGGRQDNKWRSLWWYGKPSKANSTSTRYFSRGTADLAMYLPINFRGKIALSVVVALFTLTAVFGLPIWIPQFVSMAHSDKSIGENIFVTIFTVLFMAGLIYRFFAGVYAGLLYGSVKQQLAVIYLLGMPAQLIIFDPIYRQLPATPGFIAVPLILLWFFCLAVVLGMRKLVPAFWVEVLTADGWVRAQKCYRDLATAESTAMMLHQQHPDVKAVRVSPTLVTKIV